MTSKLYSTGKIDLFIIVSKLSIQIILISYFYSKLVPWIRPCTIYGSEAPVLELLRMQSTLSL